MNFLVNLLLRVVVGRFIHFCLRFSCFIFGFLLNPVFAFFNKRLNQFFYFVFPYSSEKFRQKRIEDVCFVLFVSCLVLLLGYHFFAANGLFNLMLHNGYLVSYYVLLFFFYVLPLYMIVKSFCFPNEKSMGQKKEDKINEDNQ